MLNWNALACKIKKQKHGICQYSPLNEITLTSNYGEGDFKFFRICIEMSKRIWKCEFLSNSSCIFFFKESIYFKTYRNDS
ncbi:MAG TPA: hypothetical protein DHV06_04875 [Bacteroides thetaiotaomicron]|nr:hypothetical protein [Bacteroides thetaiotaomicron]